ncbi:MAG: hypothetical protein M0Z95_20180 [Actinomycetota bacterium]|jgi:hypothetical protein|nr:hypothetical protein [Actinomycetota bacterium]
MYRELPPIAESLEIDPALRLEWPGELRSRTEGDWLVLARELGRLAVAASNGRIHGDTHVRHYWRKNDRLSADDIRELESYFEFLRHQYGIPVGATVFPKRETTPADVIEKDDGDGS